MMTAYPHPRCDGQVTAWDPDQVAAFDLGSEEILIVERAALPGLGDSMASARVLYWRSKVTVENAPAKSSEALQALGIDLSGLREDIAALAQSFLVQFGLRETDLRVEVVDKPSCPKFHCDNLRVRLVATYYPGTQDAYNILPIHSPGPASGGSRHGHPSSRRPPAARPSPSGPPPARPACL